MMKAPGYLKNSIVAILARVEIRNASMESKFSKI